MINDGVIPKTLTSYYLSIYSYIVERPNDKLVPKVSCFILTLKVVIMTPFGLVLSFFFRRNRGFTRLFRVDGTEIRIKNRVFYRP